MGQREQVWQGIPLRKERVLRRTTIATLKLKDNDAVVAVIQKQKKTLFSSASYFCHTSLIDC